MHPFQEGRQVEMWKVLWKEETFPGNPLPSRLAMEIWDITKKAGKTSYEMVYFSELFKIILLTLLQISWTQDSKTTTWTMVTVVLSLAKLLKQAPFWDLGGEINAFKCCRIQTMPGICFRNAALTNTLQQQHNGNISLSCRLRCHLLLSNLQFIKFLHQMK